MKRMIAFAVLAFVLLVPVFAEQRLTIWKNGVLIYSGDPSQLENSADASQTASSSGSGTDIDAESFTVLGQQIDNPFRGALQFYLKIIIGAVGGALMALRFTVELVHALIMNGNEGMPGELQKVLVRFIVHFVFAMRVLIVVFIAISAILALIRPLWTA